VGSVGLGPVHSGCAVVDLGVVVCGGRFASVDSNLDRVARFSHSTVLLRGGSGKRVVVPLRVGPRGWVTANRCTVWNWKLTATSR
jgi:hypothetical protein